MNAARQLQRQISLHLQAAEAMREVLAKIERGTSSAVSHYAATCACGAPLIRETAEPFTCACGRRCEIAWRAAEHDPREPVARTISDDEEVAA